MLKARSGKRSKIENVRAHFDNPDISNHRGKENPTLAPPGGGEMASKKAIHSAEFETTERTKFWSDLFSKLPFDRVQEEEEDVAKTEETTAFAVPVTEDTADEDKSTRGEDPK